jgi:hypothetical protein
MPDRPSACLSLHLTPRLAGCGSFRLDVAVDFRPRLPGWFGLAAGDQVPDLPFEDPRDILADVLGAAMGVHQDPLEEIVLEVDSPARVRITGQTEDNGSGAESLNRLLTVYRSPGAIDLAARSSPRS